jgi:hypothetical protein
MSADAVVLHVGSLGARGTPGVRLVVALDWHETVPYLQRVGWRGPLGAAARVVGTLGRAAQGVSLCLDIGESLAPHVGIEIFPKEGSGAGAGDTEVLLDLLVSAGLCPKTKLDQMLAWRGSSAIGGGAHAVRGLSHVKVTLRGGAAKAKAYLLLAEARRVRTHPFVRVGGDDA